MTEDTPAWAARKLLRAARSATLATTTEGQPFASLVTPATTPDGSILLLLSDLSEHTRHLRADPRCAVMVTGAPTTQNAQTAPRLTITGLAEPAPEWKSRWVALHPYAAFYADFTDFNLVLIRPKAGLYIGGFASAHRLRQQDLQPRAPEIEAAEPGIIAHMNEDHAEALAAIGAAHDLPPPIRMLTADPDGFDIAHDDTVRRIPWPTPLTTTNDLRTALIDLARAARNPTITNPGRNDPAPL